MAIVYAFTKRINRYEFPAGLFLAQVAYQAIGFFLVVWQ
jgi:hypothetical protein